MVLCRSRFSCCNEPSFYFLDCTLVNAAHKTFAIFFACCAAPLLVLCLVYYLIGSHAVEAQLRQKAEQDASIIVQRVDAALGEREKDLSGLASGATGFYLSRLNKTRNAATNEYDPPHASVASTAFGKNNAVPEEVRREIDAFLVYNRKFFAFVTCFNKANQPLFRAENKTYASGATQVQTEDILASDARPDESAWTNANKTPLHSTVARAASGACIRYTVPLIDLNENNSAVLGAFVTDLNLDELLNDAASERATSVPSSLSSAPKKSSQSPRAIIVIDGAGQIIYHTNEALRYQTLERALPSFKYIAEGMKQEASGHSFFDAADGDSWLAAYRPLPALGLSLTVMEDYSMATRSLRRMFWLSAGLALLAALLAATLLLRFVGRTKGSLEHVTENAVAIAQGNLDQRIELRSSDDMRLIAETFNQMTERLREQMAREAETRQFESFMRLSAMLTHDLKNAIASLSLIVRNMERQFHHAEFRADAMLSLTDATDKLRSLVAKLSEPVRSLSGEFPMPRPVDLTPVLRRVLAAHAESVSGIYEIETRLPETLVAIVDVERIEKVIENLVLNALEAMGARGGKLIIGGGTESEREIFFSVADTGPGMSEEFQRTKLFHAFATTKQKGVGLGLYTCREMVKAHGGRIEVESKRDAGTCFRVVLPSSHTTAKADSQPL